MCANISCITSAGFFFSNISPTKGNETHGASLLYIFSLVLRWCMKARRNLRVHWNDNREKNWIERREWSLLMYLVLFEFRHGQFYQPCKGLHFKCAKKRRGERTKIRTNSNLKSEHMECSGFLCIILKKIYAEVIIVRMQTGCITIIIAVFSTFDRWFYFYFNT